MTTAAAGQLGQLLLRAYDGHTRTVHAAASIGAGSSGVIHRVRETNALALKLVHRKDDQALAARIDAFWELGLGWTLDPGGRLRVAWPYAKAFDAQNGQLRGYAMPMLAPPAYHELSRMLRAGAGDASGFRDPSWAQNLRLAAGVARTVAAVNERGMVVADLSAENVFVSEAGSAVLVDLDGWQLRHPRTRQLIRCQGSREEVTPPEHLGRGDPTEPREPASDWWALAVVIGTVLFRGTHPFAGVRPGEPVYWEEADHVKQRMCWLLDPALRVPKGTPPLRILTGNLYRLFEACFDRGYDQPSLRPTPSKWVEVIEAALGELTSCDRDPLHLYPRGSRGCPWCAAGSGAAPMTAASGTEPAKRPAAARTREVRFFPSRARTA